MPVEQHFEKKRKILYFTKHIETKAFFHWSKIYLKIYQVGMLNLFEEYPEKNIEFFFSHHCHLLFFFFFVFNF